MSLSQTFLGALLVSLPLMASGCVSCSVGEVQCDENGCYICDAYGCRPADPNDDDGPSSGGPGGDGSGGSPGTGGTGQGTGGSTGQGASSGDGGGSSSQGGGGGGEPGCDPAIVTCPCGPAGECPTDLACIDGKCLPGCSFDFQCGPDHVCADGACVDACIATVPCPAGYECVGGGCLADPLNPECTSAGDCGGMQCVGGFCTQLCDSNDDCPTGELCDASSGSCFEDTTPSPFCDGSTPCPGEGQTCNADGYCIYSCTTLTQCKLFDARFEGCDDGVCKTGPELAPECTLADPCPNLESCVSNQCVP